jgi:hypothetical protein
MRALLLLLLLLLGCSLRIRPRPLSNHKLQPAALLAQLVELLPLCLHLLLQLLKLCAEGFRDSL